MKIGDDFTSVSWFSMHFLRNFKRIDSNVSWSSLTTRIFFRKFDSSTIKTLNSFGKFKVSADYSKFLKRSDWSEIFSMISPNQWIYVENFVK